MVTYTPHFSYDNSVNITTECDDTIALLECMKVKYIRKERIYKLTRIKYNKFCALVDNGFLADKNYPDDYATFYNHRLDVYGLTLEQALDYCKKLPYRCPKTIDMFDSK